MIIDKAWRWWRPLRPAQTCIVALAFVLAGCVGPPSGVTCGVGTTRVGDLCVAVEPDGGSPQHDAGTVMTQMGDSLRIYPETFELAPGLQVCPDLTILHANGTTDAVDGTSGGITVSTFDGTTATASLPGDCRGIGVLGAAAGETTATVTVVGSGGTLSATVPVHVAALTVHVTVEGVSLPVGSDVALPIEFKAESDGGALVYLDSATLVPRLLVGFSAADPSLATLTAPAFGGAAAAPQGVPGRIHGVAAGTTHAAGQYGLPGGLTAIDTDGALIVADVGTLVDFEQITYSQGGSVMRWAYNHESQSGRVLPPASCYEVAVTAIYQDSGGHRYTQDLSDQATWSASNALGTVTTAAGAPTRYCTVGRGDTALSVCVGAICMRDDFAVYAPGDVASLAVTGSLVFTEGASLGGFSGCPAVRVVATLAAGGTRDLTDSPALDWFAVSGGTIIEREANTSGALVDDTQGDPCLGGTGPNQRGYMFSLQLSYAGAADTVSATVN